MSEPAPPRPPGRPPSRTLWSDLRAIDEALVPRITALLRWVRDRWLALGRRLEWIGAAVYWVAGVGRALRSTRAGRGDARPAPAGSEGARGTLHRLDERYAGSGPLALVRDVPQVGVIALASIVTVAALTVAIRGGDGDGATDDTLGEGVPTVVSPGSTTVGPYPLERVHDYIDRAHTQLVVRASQSPIEPVYALADFDTPLTPADATAAVPGVVPVQIFIHVDVPPSATCAPDEGKPISTKLPDEAGVEFTRLAMCLEGEAQDNANQARDIDPTTELLARQKRSYAHDARRERAAAAQLRASCACITAMVIQATPERLSAIANSGTVRLIDPAQPGQRPGDICWVPLVGDRPVQTACSSQVP